MRSHRKSCQLVTSLFSNLISTGGSYLRSGFLALISLPTLVKGEISRYVVKNETNTTYRSLVSFTEFASEVVKNYGEAIEEAGGEIVSGIPSWTAPYLISLCRYPVIHFYDPYYAEATLTLPSINTSFAPFHAKNLQLLTTACQREKAFIDFQINKMAVGLSAGVSTGVVLCWLWSFYRKKTMSQRNNSTMVRCWVSPVATLTYYSLILPFVLIPTESLAVTGVVSACGMFLLFIPKIIELLWCPKPGDSLTKYEQQNPDPPLSSKTRRPTSEPSTPTLTTPLLGAIHPDSGQDPQEEFGLGTLKQRSFLFPSSPPQAGYVPPSPSYQGGYVPPSSSAPDEWLQAPRSEAP